MYLLLFNAISDSLNETDINKLKQMLMEAQLSAEELCMNSEETI